MIAFSVNASLKIRYIDDWIKLYYNTFNELCQKYNVKCPYTLELVEKMFWHVFPHEMLFSFIVLLNYYSKVESEHFQNALLGRIISSFELIRKNYE